MEVDVSCAEDFDAQLSSCPERFLELKIAVRRRVMERDDATKWAN